MIGRWFSGARDPSLLPNTRLGGPMPWVFAIMVALSVVATAASLALGAATARARAELAGGVTIQIMAASADARHHQADAALDRLHALPQVADARAVPDAEIDALLAPWLGQGGQEPGGGDTAVLPVPLLIDVRLAGAADAPALDGLRRAVLAVAPDARIDAAALWLDPVFAAISAADWLARGIIVLAAVATCATVGLAARHALDMQRETIAVVHMLGATDRQIARLFERALARETALGGLAGWLAGLAVVLAMGQRLAGLQAGLMAGTALGWADWLVLAAIPWGGVVLAGLTARFTALLALRQYR